MSLPYGFNEPAPASKEELLETLRDVIALVEADDSFEGFIQYSMPTPDPCGRCDNTGVFLGSRCEVCDGVGDVYNPPVLEGADFGLMARYRTGNSMGQGGMTIFSKPREEGAGDPGDSST